MSITATVLGFLVGTSLSFTPVNGPIHIIVPDIPFENKTDFFDIFSRSDWVEDTDTGLTIHVDLGGAIDSYIARIDSNRDLAVRILGTCESSCTMFLGLKNVCIADTANMGFHGPSSDDHADDPVYMRDLALKISAQYPTELKHLFEDKWSRSQRLTWFSGAEVRAMVPSIAKCE